MIATYYKLSTNAYIRDGSLIFLNLLPLPTNSLVHREFEGKKNTAFVGSRKWSGTIKVILRNHVGFALRQK